MITRYHSVFQQAQTGHLIGTVLNSLVSVSCVSSYIKHV